MTTREEFKRRYNDTFNITSELAKNQCESAWQACDELNKARIEELEEARQILMDNTRTLIRMYEALELENKTLREALEKLKYMAGSHTIAKDDPNPHPCGFQRMYETANEALSTPTSTEHLEDKP